MADRRDRGDRRQGATREERRLGDRRESHRVPIRVEVKEENKHWVNHEGNVAIGGMYFSKPLDLPTGAVVKLRFDLPGMEKRIEVKAEVVEITAVGKPSEVGTRVRFTDLDLRSELLIARFLDQNPEA